MRERLPKTAYQWADATERLQSIRNAIEREEVSLHSQEWAITKTKANITRLEHDRDKVTAGLVKRP